LDPNRRQTVSQGCRRKGYRDCLPRLFRGEPPCETVCLEVRPPIPCWRRVYRYLVSISAAMKSALSGLSGEGPEGSLEFRGMVKPLALFCRHIALLARCLLVTCSLPPASLLAYCLLVVIGLADRRQETATCEHIQHERLWACTFALS
jgi:hypothetical protein